LPRVANGRSAALKNLNTFGLMRRHVDILTWHEDKETVSARTLSSRQKYANHPICFSSWEIMLPKKDHYFQERSHQ